ncbi:esterase-like activity of phytase family protein [Pannus brasiliensis CCIBt3594]|uniref:Esterase-like activity of phytase family protein n=1 Tax=Pannus brasiliensis CCIBt3594 TaxID=1427578 RepID=A0AAW9QWF7_9CHRO
MFDRFYNRLTAGKIRFPILRGFLLSILALVLVACGTSPRVMAQDRMFLPLSVEFLGEYRLPKEEFQGTSVGGISAITRDRQTDRFYLLSDDRSERNPARFYTARLELNGTKLEKVSIEGVTTLKNANGETYPKGSIDPEGIALSPRNTFFISSEGAVKQGIAPSIAEFDRSGQVKTPLAIPTRFLPDAENRRGIRENLGFEALTLGITSTLPDDPFRLFTANESALVQDSPTGKSIENRRVRLLHYVIDPIGSPVLVAEHLYLLDEAPDSAIYHGLTELLALEREGYFLSLERTFGLEGFGAKLFQVVNASATDTSKITSLSGELETLQVRPLEKKLLLDLGTLGIDLDNLEAMAIGPRLPSGDRSLILVSDDNFRKDQVTQFLLFRLKEK